MADRSKSGNDPDARKELVSQYGEGHGNAEDLIRAHDDGYDPDLQAALQKPVTGRPDLSAIKPKFKGGVVESAVLRGGKLVVVENVDGEHVKWYDDPPSAAKKSAEKKSATTPADDGSGSGDGGNADGGNADDGSGSGSTSTNPPAPKEVTVKAMLASLDDAQITVPPETTLKDDVWALVPEDTRETLIKEAASS